MATQAIHGRNGMVYIQGSGATAINILQARSWKITIDKALDEDNKFGDGWVTQLLGLQKWTGSAEGNLDTGDTTPWDATQTGTTVNAYFYPVSGSTTHYYYGTIWPKLDINESFDSVVRFTMDFDGDGPLSIH